MEIRQAKNSDVKTIHTLINSYAENDRMLFRPHAEIYEKLLQFSVAVSEEGDVVGCAAMKVIWDALAEVQSLAVDKKHMGTGVGKALVKHIIEKSKALEIKNLFTLTLEPVFFEKMGFEIVEKDTLPMKVWTDCARCPKQDHCDETALLYKLDNKAKFQSNKEN